MSIMLWLTGGGDFWRKRKVRKLQRALIYGSRPIIDGMNNRAIRYVQERSHERWSTVDDLLVKINIGVNNSLFYSVPFVAGLQPLPAESGICYLCRQDSSGEHPSISVTTIPVQTEITPLSVHLSREVTNTLKTSSFTYGQMVSLMVPAIASEICSKIVTDIFNTAALVEMSDLSPSGIRQEIASPHTQVTLDATKVVIVTTQDAAASIIAAFSDTYAPCITFVNTPIRQLGDLGNGCILVLAECDANIEHSTQAVVTTTSSQTGVGYIFAPGVAVVIDPTTSSGDVITLGTSSATIHRPEDAVYYKKINLTK